MRIKGEMLIELTDVRTGAVERIEEKNMVTHVLNNIFGLNPYGTFYQITKYSDTNIAWNEEFLPICPNLIGGILLYPETLTEDKDNLYEKSKNLPVAYASNDVNGTVDLARGSLNLTESKRLDDGYKFVWEFTPSQGNGTIAAVALTNKYGGQSAYGSSVSDSKIFLSLKQLSVTGINRAELRSFIDSVEVDFENELMYSVSFSDDGSLIIHKIRMPFFTLGLNETLSDDAYTTLEEVELPASTFKPTSSARLYGDIMDGGDGYWYGFTNDSGNSSGNAVIKWIKISKQGYSFIEGSWTLPNATLYQIGSRSYPSNSVERNIYACLRNGYLYVMSYDKKGVYKINISNEADVTLIELGFTSSWKTISDMSAYSALNMILIGDLIIARDFLITSDDRIIKTAGEAKIDYAGSPVFQYKNFFFEWGLSGASLRRGTYLLSPYNATINNLSTPIVKDTSKTMKITYTVREEA